MNRVLIWLVVMLGCALWGGRAEAQLGRGTLRFSVDGDMLSIGGVRHEPTDGTTVVGVGPNQLGFARAGSALPTPVSLGFGYVLQPALILGLRAGFGFDLVAPDNTPDTHYLALALMPGLTWVPAGQKTKLALSASTIFQVDRATRDKGYDIIPKERKRLGGFSLGVSALIFARDNLSADLGFFFEGRYGKDLHPEEHIRDLRCVVRLGVSFWR